MRILVNGEEVQLDRECTVADLVERSRMADRPCAVEVNAEIVHWRRRGDTPLRDGDRVEIVTLVGGG